MWQVCREEHISTRLRPHGGLLLWDKSDYGSQEVPGILGLNNPAMDGIDHINVYSKGSTELGRFLSNFADSGFNCSDGRFRSIEGYWYWLGTNHSDRDELRRLCGWEAKSYGRFLASLPEWRVRDPNFQAKIKWAVQEKLWAYPQYLKQLSECKLPLTHYYLIVDRIKTAPQHNWVIDYLEGFKNK